MPERVHELRRLAPDPVPETTAPIDVKLRADLKVRLYVA
jgi:hypothetical protein